MNRGWQYHRGDAGEGAAAFDYRDDGWQRVVLPHTYQLTSVNLDDSEDDSSQPTFHRDISWYRRRLQRRFAPGERVFLEFEGAHQITDLWVNGRHVGQHSTGGYTPFHFDITNHVRRDGDNQIALRLDNRPNVEVPPDGFTRDYVLFGGLYRDVRLVVTEPLHITFPWEARRAGVRVTTPSVTPRHATVTVATAIRNTSEKPQECEVLTLIADADGHVVERLASRVEVLPRADEVCVQTGGIGDGTVDLPRLWSPRDPYLYRVHSIVRRGGEVIDHLVNPLGLRWFEHNADRGLMLNGEPVELIGANRHQQYPYLGDAVPDNLHRADAIKFKRCGFNVIRLAHYPHDNAFLDACDELGLLVVEEAPTWIEFGPPAWMDRLEQAQRVMIRNHRNHPCVWGWGGGINHRGPVKRLHYAAKEEDPTRVTMSNSTLWTGPVHAGVTDLYSVMDYRGARLPESGLLFAMEHGGSLDTRGHQRIVSRYRGDPRRIGLALWAAHDGYSFIKRGPPWPNLSVWSAADWDLFRTPKPAFYWHRSELTDEPMVHIPDDRAQQPGSVTVFSNCQRVVLEADGQTHTLDKPARPEEIKHLRSPPFVFEIDWPEGPITAVGYIEGRPAATHTVRKPGGPHQLRLEFDRDGFDGVANGSSVVLARATVCDERGVVVPQETPPVTFSLSGPGRIVDDGRIGANPVVWQRGVAPVLVRVGEEPGEIRLTASADGLTPATTTLTLDRRAGERLRIAMPTQPIRHRVDLGGTDQHVEEGWSAWSGPKETAASVSFTADADAGTPPVRLTIRGVDSPLRFRSRWGVPGDRCFLIEDGVECSGPLRLMIEGLPAGDYTIRTWHHRVVDLRDDAPPLSFTATDARGEGRPLLSDYLPTFGKKIKVSTAGGGGRGDDGSASAASHPAVLAVAAEAGSPVTLDIRPTTAGGTLTLNGLEVLQLLGPK